ncbi:sialate O-acetylesterase [Mucilaginibacter sp. SMC90]|uniref:sialate O-acetylesterase n=1 Tax=Mucilaginibacter sp. SMC90 TaxID=2929803 RepID=UPI001FB51A2D|nr:sialate O-acetylesterase [Mucilaginibacter sp. SMC90]UOE46214.1 sialate O-acetylesterase [Mucilaginibacter sp. SMC90]
MKMKYLSLCLFVAFNLYICSASAQNKKFYIFLCFGQSNMEGNAHIQPQDTVVDPRLQVLETVDCPNLKRTKGNWYTAVPPLARCNTGLTPADYFGRTLIANLPHDITVGIVNVSVAGCKIELFQKNSYKDYAATAPSWMVNMINEYGGNPYGHLVEMAKLAQKNGVIKGILLHQGESNPNDTLWTQKVKSIYDMLIKDLRLKSRKVPLLAGQLVNEDQGGKCAAMNQIIDKLPDVIPNAYVINSSGCTSAPDKLHFTAEGYRILGTRYGLKMLSLLGYKSVTATDAVTTGSTGK